jgi:hypothetical protein
MQQTSAKRMVVLNPSGSFLSRVISSAFLKDLETVMQQFDKGGWSDLLRVIGDDDTPRSRTSFSPDNPGLSSQPMADMGSLLVVQTDECHLYPKAAPCGMTDCHALFAQFLSHIEIVHPKADRFNLCAAQTDLTFSISF